MAPENHTKEPKFHYAWIVFAACFATLLMLGAMFYSFGIFFKPLIEEFGWSRALTSSVNTTYLLAFAVSTIVLGRLTDKLGPRIVLIIGGIMTGGGYVLCSQIDRIFFLYLFYIIIGLGSGATWVLPVATIQRWFLKFRGLILGLATTGVGLGALIFAPTINYFNESYGWRTSYIILGILCLIVLSAASIVIVLDPKKKGLKPYGSEAFSPTPDDKPEGPGADASNPDEWTVGEAMKTKEFYILSIVYLFTVFPIYMIAVHIVAYATDIGISSGLAAAALGLIGGASIVGRIVMGMSVEKIGWKTALTICCFLSAAAICWLLGIKNSWMLYTFVIVYGFSYGGKVPLVPGLVGHFYGTLSLASMIGIIHSIAIVGGAAAPILAGYVFDKTGSYTIAFSIAAASFALAGLLSIVVKKPKKH